MDPDERVSVVFTDDSDKDDEKSEIGQDTDDEDAEEIWRVANLLAQLGVENGDGGLEQSGSVVNGPSGPPLPLQQPIPQPIQMVPPSPQTPPASPTPPIHPAPPLRDRPLRAEESVIQSMQAAQMGPEPLNINNCPISEFSRPPTQDSAFLRQGTQQASHHAAAKLGYVRFPQVQTFQQPLPHESQATLSPQAFETPSIFMLIGVLLLTHSLTQLVANSNYVQGLLISILIAISLVIGLTLLRSRHLTTNLVTHENQLHYDSTQQRDTDDLRQDNRGQNDSILADPPLPFQVAARTSPDSFQRSHQIKASGNTIIITVRSVRYGSYWNKPAAIILFCFEILRRKGREPAQAGTIKIKFADSGTTLGPVVSVLFPKLLFGKLSAESHIRGTQITGGVNTSSAFPVVATGNVQGTSQRSFTRDQRLRIDGAPDHDKKNGPNSVARWIMTANKVQKNGVPPEFLTGVVLSHNQISFSATVKVTLGNLQWKTPWSNPGVCFNFDAQNVPPDCALYGMEELERDFSGLSEEQYKKLAPFNDEYQVSPTGNSMDN